MTEPSLASPLQAPEASSAKGAPQLVPVAILWAAAVALVGGLATGLLLVRFGMVGGVGLWAAGALGGFVARRIVRAPCRPVAWSLVVACCLAFALAEVSWYRWALTLPDGAGGQREPTWSEAFTKAPSYFWQSGQLSLFVGALFAGFGAHSAYLQTGKRYRMVAVEE